MKFHNRRYFTHQTFNILSSSLKVHKKGLLDEIEYDIPFDNIHNKKTIQTQINNNLVIVGIFFMAFSFLFLLGTAEQLAYIFFLFGTAFVVGAFINRKKVVTIPTYSGDQIVLFFSAGSKQEVIEFSEKIINASNNYLLKKYSKIDKALPIEPQIESLRFLLNREIISEHDFEILKNQVLGREGKSTIGFG